MKNEDLLDLLNEIDEEYIESASKRLENLHEFERKEFGEEMRPQVIRVERTPRKPVPFRTGALAAAAAVLVCAVTVGVYVKLNMPPSYSPGSGVVLSEASHISEPSVPETTSPEPVSSDTASLEPISYEPTSRETISSDPAVTEPKIKRVEQEGYDFVLEVGEREWISPFSEPFIKTDSSDELAICFNAGDASAEYPLYIAFYLQKDIDDPDASPIADLRITRAGMQWHSVTYSEKPEPGEKIVMQLSAKTLGRVYIKGQILP